MDVRLDKYLWAVRIFKTRSDAADAIKNNRVTGLVSNRQPAKNVALYCENITPQSELDKLNIPRETIFVFRERGTGRPTKKERREIDAVMEGMFYDEDAFFDDDE